jgi:hypothetical protein
MSTIVFLVQRDRTDSVFDSLSLFLQTETIDDVYNERRVCAFTSVRRSTIKDEYNQIIDKTKIESFKAFLPSHFKGYISAFIDYQYENNVYCKFELNVHLYANDPTFIEELKLLVSKIEEAIQPVVIFADIENERYFFKAQAGFIEIKNISGAHSVSDILNSISLINEITIHPIYD